MEKSEDDHSFVREYILPSKRKRQKEFLWLFARMALCGAVFGVTAGIFFVMTENLLGAQTAEYQEISEQGSDAKAEEQQEEAMLIQAAAKKENSEKKKNNYRKKITKWNRSVVAVYAQTKRSDGQIVYKQDAGFGIAVAKENERLYFLTGYMIFTSETQDLKVEFFDGSVCPAKMEGKDEEADIAVVSTSLEKVPESVQNTMEIIDIGGAAQLQTGSEVVLIGQPNGTLYSADLGIISGPSEKEYIVDYSLDIYPTNILRNDIGSGAVMSADGKLLGIFTESSAESFGNHTVYFSSILGLKRIFTKMIAKDSLIYCGIKAENIPQSKRADMGITNGIYVMEIQPNSPAANAGIRAGDIIQKVGDTEISSLVDFYTAISEYEVNAVAEIAALHSALEQKQEHIYHVRLQEKES